MMRLLKRRIKRRIKNPVLFFLAVLWLLSTLIFTRSVLANGRYHCVIQDQIQTADSGKRLTASARQVSYDRRQQFIVDRSSGRVMGDVFANHDAQRVEILDPGSQQQAFKLLAVFGPNISVDYLQIKEYHLQGAKPFTGMSQGKAYTGVCDHQL